MSAAVTTCETPCPECAGTVTRKVTHNRHGTGVELACQDCDWVDDDVWIDEP